MAALIDIETQRRFELGELTTIGRDASCAVPLDDSMVGARHAEIRRGDDGRYQLLDLGTRRGTFRGDRRVSDAVLADGDELLMGAVRLRFVDAAPAQVPAPSGKEEKRKRDSRAITYKPAAEIGDQEVLRRDYEKLRAAVELSRALCEVQGLDAMLSAVLDTCFGLLPADRGVIVLVGRGGVQPTHKLSRDRDGQSAEVLLSTSVVSQVMESKKGLIASDTGGDPLFGRSSSLVLQSVRSALCVPMVHADEMIGLIHLDSRSAGNAFVGKDLDLLGAIAAQAAAAIRSALLAEQVQGVVAAERQRLSRILRDSPDGVVLLDAAFRVLLLNPRAAQILPSLSPATVGAQLDQVGPVSIAELLARGGTQDVTVEGSPRKVISVRAVESPAPEGSEIVLLLHDVTEEREHGARSAHEERLALIGQLAGGVAHDFNNLLAVISNFAAFAKEASTDPAIRGDIGEIESAAARAAALTRQLLAFSRRELVRPKVLLIEPLIVDMEKLLRRSLREDIELELLFGETPYRVKADPSKLEQVLLNLAVNARDAMPNGGKLVIETSSVLLAGRPARLKSLPAGRYVCLAVHDTGSGMTPEVAARIFEPFFTTKERGQGTGLGLATVFGIVQQAGGAISVRSEVARGTTFEVFLPTTDEPLEEKTVRPVTRAGGVETVLLAEDEPAVRDLTRRILTDAGYRVLDAPDGDRALQVAGDHTEAIDLLLTDLVMPGMSGKALAQRIRSRRAGTRILFMSGYFDEATDAADGGDADLLAKPFSRDELLSRVRAALDGALH